MGTINELSEKIRKAWNIQTCFPGLREKWSPEIPETGQCAVTALLIQEKLGGIIVFNREYHHYWNILPNDGELDLTRTQFGDVKYMKIDGYRDRDYFLQNEDTFIRLNLLRIFAA